MYNKIKCNKLANWYNPLRKLNFLDKFAKKKPQISNLMKILPVGAVLFRAERQTKMRKLIVTICSLANAPKNRGHPVAQLVEAMRYKSEGRGFCSRWYHCNFSST